MSKTGYFTPSTRKYCGFVSRSQRLCFGLFGEQAQEFGFGDGLRVPFAVMAADDGDGIGGDFSSGLSASSDVTGDDFGGGLGHV